MRKFLAVSELADITRVTDQFRRLEPLPTRYYIDGHEVDEATYERERAKEEA